ncbi:unnamed protein product [Cylicocyclus nassatus]|uniref:Uncharacterized protein n=1 Tax=Cylicocyclus nassatus TaxID=53992 RepID=A0AA36GSW0_CYLNA|nr:unnamed protein product [Cylicocyclus nassatus]
MSEDPSSAFSPSIFSRLKSDGKILHAFVLILAGIAVLTSMSFACALVALLRQKRSHRQITVEPRYQPYPPSNRRALEEENRDKSLSECMPMRNLA